MSKKSTDLSNEGLEQVTGGSRKQMILPHHFPASKENIIPNKISTCVGFVPSSNTEDFQENVRTGGSHCGIYIGDGQMTHTS